MKFPIGFKKLIESNAMSLATIDSHGRPHTIGIAFVKFREGKLLITDNYMNTSVSNLQKNSAVSIAVWNKNWKGFGIDGKAKYYSSGKWHDFAKKMKENKGEPCKGAIVVTPSKIRKLA